jgi:hypothetical protein
VNNSFATGVPEGESSQTAREEIGPIARRSPANSREHLVENQMVTMA